ncbi:MAG: hypothetical protein CM15mV51_0660 [uncultured marine virus]|nr:MAG: hypothetical protein CM15mV51_0660 [uncultured marine virus]
MLYYQELEILIHKKEGAAYFDPKKNTIGYADMYENDTGLQHLTTHELDQKKCSSRC